MEWERKSRRSLIHSGRWMPKAAGCEGGLQPQLSDVVTSSVSFSAPLRLGCQAKHSKRDAFECLVESREY